MLLILAMFVLFTDDSGGPPTATEGTAEGGTELLLMDVVVAVGAVAGFALLTDDAELLFGGVGKRSRSFAWC